GTEQASREALGGAVLDWNVESAARVSRALIGANFLSEQPNWFEDWREQVARTYDLPMVRELGRLAARHDDYRANSESIRVPTLVITGGSDSVVSTQRAQAMADRIPDARLGELTDTRPAPRL